MAEIGGKGVVFRDSMPAAVWWPLFPKITAVKAGQPLLKELDWDTAVQLCQACIESWEFEGDPADAAAYGALEFSDMAQLVAEAYGHVVELSNRRTSEAGE